MLLAIDIGNTNTVFGLFEGSEIRETWRMPTPITDLKNIPDVDTAIIASVVPGAEVEIATLLQCDPVLVTHDMVKIADTIKSPDEIGADRLVNAAAVKAIYEGPAIVLDFGTATTFDVVNAAGEYAGGVIAPGINLSLEALHHAAAKLPQIEIEKPRHMIGTTTLDAMQSGVYHGYLGLIKEIVNGIENELGQKAKIIATGGLARLFVDDLDIIDHIDDDLTLKGLKVIYERISKI